MTQRKVLRLSSLPWWWRLLHAVARRLDRFLLTHPVGHADLEIVDDNLEAIPR